MTRFLLTLLTVALAVLLQSTLLTDLRLLDGPPVPALVFAVAWALAGGLEEGLLWALLGGLLTDAVSAAPPGTNVLALALAVLATAGVAGSQFTASSFLPLVGIVVATFVYYLSAALVLQVTGWSIPWLAVATETALPSAALNAALVFPVYWVVSAIVRRRQYVVGLR